MQIEKPNTEEVVMSYNLEGLPLQQTNNNNNDDKNNIIILLEHMNKLNQSFK